MRISPTGLDPEAGRPALPRLALGLHRILPDVALSLSHDDVFNISCYGFTFHRLFATWLANPGPSPVRSVQREGSRVGGRLRAGDRAYGLFGGQEPGVVEGYRLHAGAVSQPDERHQRRRDPAVEAEVVRPAGAHRRGELEAGLD